MAKFEKKRQAFSLRRSGKSINHIAKKLGISKGTASLWCRDVPLTPSQAERLRLNSIRGGRKGRMLGAEMNRQKKLDAIAEGKRVAGRDVRTITERDLLMLAIALYWAEGSKTESRFIFVNSDPEMLKIMFKFLIEKLNVSRRDISITIQINQSHRARIDDVTHYWSKRLGVPRSRFTKPYFVFAKAKKVYLNHNVHYGTVRMRVLRGSSLQYRMLGYIDVLKEAIC
jgi:transcriptional regulator with XRE-family HTH domain